MKKLALFLAAALMVSALALPASAVGFTASVQQKPAPTVSTMTDASGNQVAGIIRDANGNEIAGVTADQMTVTSIADAASAGGAISEQLTAAYQQIQSAASLADIVPDIASFLQAIGSSAAVEDMTVRDVFDVSVTGAAADALAAGNNITFRFDIGIAPGSTLLVLHNYEGSQWEIIPNDRVIINSDGTVDVTFDSLSPIAFAVDTKETSTAAGTTSASAPTSPQTGDNGLNTVAGLGVVALGCVALASSAVIWKKRAQN